MFRTKLPAMISSSLAFRWHSLVFIPDGERKLISPGGVGAVMRSQGRKSPSLERGMLCLLLVPEQNQAA